MSKITRLSQFNWGSDDIFRVSGVIDDPKARICWIDPISKNSVNFSPLCAVGKAKVLNLSTLEEGLKTGSIKIMCVERA